MDFIIQPNTKKKKSKKKSHDQMVAIPKFIISVVSRKRARYYEFASWKMHPQKSSLHYTNSDNLCKCEVWNSKELGHSWVLGAWYPQMMCDCRNPDFIALKVTRLSWVCSLRSKFTGKTSDLINNNIKELEDNH